MRFKKSDRRAMLLLFVAAVGLWGGIVIDRLWLKHKEPLMAFSEIPEDSIRLDSVYKRSVVFRQRRNESGRYDAIPERVVETFPFDPNTADSATLVRLGLASWQVRSIFKYRSKGGRYHKATDFQRVPGMTPELWERLAPVMRIGEAYRYYHEERDSLRNQDRPADTTLYSRQEKYHKVVMLDLNRADTAALKMIPGIGPVRARRIVRYREELGGFYAVSQLSEVEDLPGGIEKWFKIETGIFRKLYINQMSYSELAHHPYINYAQARVIINHRRIAGAIKNLGEFRLLDEFTEKDFKRLEPYIEY